MTQGELQVITTVYADGPCSLEHVAFDLMLQLGLSHIEAMATARRVLERSEYVGVESDDLGTYCFAKCSTSPL